MPATNAKTEKSLAERTMDYWELQRAARGLQSSIKHPTVEVVLSITTNGLKHLNPARPLAVRFEHLKWEAIDNGGRKAKKNETAATVSYLPTLKKVVAQ